MTVNSSVVTRVGQEEGFSTKGQHKGTVGS